MHNHRSNYNIYFRFLEENLGNRFENVNTDSPVYLELEQHCRSLDQSFHIANGLSIKIIFADKGLGPSIGLPHATDASQLSANSFFYATHPDHKVSFQAGLTKLISLSYLLCHHRENYILYSRIFPLKDLAGRYNQLLFQCYVFKPFPAEERTFALVVTTIINHLYDPKQGIYVYLGNDLTHFRYPDAALLGSTINLSTRQRIILDMLAKAKTSAEISEALFLSKHTIDTHRRNILKKTGYTSTTSLIKDLTDKGII